MLTFKEFLHLYDKENAVVLLEGKRNVLEEDKNKLFALGRLLASTTKNIIFRSGNADGADQYFSDGVTSVDNKKLQVITPYTGHRKNSNNAFDTITIDNMDIAAAPEIIYHSKMNKKMGKLIDQYVSNDINRYSIKAAYIIRDTVKAVGTDTIGPATFGIFYDDLYNPRTGGTGHTMQVCEQIGVPIINQTVWFKWLFE